MSRHISLIVAAMRPAPACFSGHLARVSGEYLQINVVHKTWYRLYALRATVAVGQVFGLVADIGVEYGEAGRKLHVAKVPVPSCVLRRDAFHWIVYQHLLE